MKEEGMLSFKWLSKIVGMGKKGGNVVVGLLTKTKAL